MSVCFYVDAEHPANSRTRGIFHALWFSALCLLIGAVLAASPVFGQIHEPEWQVQVRKYSEAKDWDSAMIIVNREVARAPQDADVRAWRARVLTWSGRLEDAEK